MSMDVMSSGSVLGRTGSGLTYKWSRPHKRWIGALIVVAFEDGFAVCLGKIVEQSAFEGWKHRCH